MLGNGEAPIIHPDQECHYQRPEWDRIPKGNNLTSSLIAKGYNPKATRPRKDFGRLKQGFVHKRRFARTSTWKTYRHTGRVHGPAPGQAHQDGAQQEHHGPAQNTGARDISGMIDGNGINDESSKTSPEPLNYFIGKTHWRSMQPEPCSILSARHCSPRPSTGGAGTGSTCCGTRHPV